MQEATIRAHLAIIRGECKRVEAEYLVLGELTEGYVRWLGVLGLDEDPSGHSGVDGRAEGSGTPVDVWDGPGAADDSRQAVGSPLDVAEPLGAHADTVEAFEVDVEDLDVSAPRTGLGG